jgi:hypothetical protein
VTTVTAAAASIPTSTLAPTAVPAPPSAWRFENDARVRSIVKTIPGRLGLLVIFTGLMAVTRVPAWWQTSIVLALISLFPRHRKILVTLAALGWLVLMPPLLKHPTDPHLFAQFAAAKGAGEWLKFWPIVGVVVWLFGMVYSWLVGKYPDSPIGRRPVTGLIVLLVSLLILQDHLTGLTWWGVSTFAIIFGHFIWYFAYSCNDAQRTDGTTRPVQPGFWRPFWSVNKIPLGKGAAYLERCEAKNDEEFATAQLKGLKLIWWATLLSILRVVADAVVYGPAGVSLTKIPYFDPPGFLPQYSTALQAHLAGHEYPLHVRWLVLIAAFLFNVLYISIWGHKAIAVCRMAGFNVLRNTYRPLESTSIAEFYNRFHYYLKEFLATFFFFPCYLRYFKKHPRLRLFMATMAAACAGNFMYHFLHYDRTIFQYGFWEALRLFHHFLVYGLILGTAIGLSQLRNSRRRKPPTGYRKAMAIAGVLFFYTLITMFDETFTHVSALDYGSYFLSLWRL